VSSEDRFRTLPELQARAIADSRSWFPDVHASQQSAVVHFGLGVAGEVGELVNLIKKRNRAGWPGPVDGWTENVSHEAADVVIYLMDICAELGIDLAAAIEAKRAILIERWGEP
jgi:NTP pyrophosphatase (non-canonical NTP hydrolase)